MQFVKCCAVSGMRSRIESWMGDIFTAVMSLPLKTGRIDSFGPTAFEKTLLSKPASETRQS